jgi:hypothetical protein
VRNKRKMSSSQAPIAKTDRQREMIRNDSLVNEEGKYGKWKTAQRLSSCVKSMDRIAKIAQFAVDSLQPAALSSLAGCHSQRSSSLRRFARPLRAVRKPVVLLLTVIADLQMLAPSQLGGITFVAADVDIRHRYQGLPCRGCAVAFEGAESDVGEGWGGYCWGGTWLILAHKVGWVFL